MRKSPTILLLLCLIVSNTLLAIPAKRINRTFTQPDGSEITIVLQGDEHFKYYSTSDGIMLKKDNNGYFKYAVSDADGNIIPGKLIAQDPQNRSTDANAYVKEISENKLKPSKNKQRSQNPMIKLPGAIGSSQFPNKGEVKGLIILAQFKDQAFSEVGTRNEFTKMMNEEGYSNYRATGSARDYFMDQSYNAFLPTFDVVGPVTLPENMEYYGGNRGSGGSDKDPAQMVVDACKLADSDLGVDFSQYDYDKDGKVDLVYIIYAGYAEAQGAPDYTIWPHAWDISYGGKSLTLDGKKIRNYACSSELRLSSGTELDGIGSFCHEFSHCLGLPDLYDSQGEGGYGLEVWSIMDSGCYNNDSRTPPCYSAFERYSLSWLVPEVLKSAQKNITLENLSTSNKAYIIESDSNKDEFFTLENRQQEGWDKYLPGHGLMITHINYKVSNWTNNTVNSPKGSERVQIVPADNILSEKTTDGDAFPGPSGNNSFTDVSSPAATLANGSFLGKPVTNIIEKDGIISFNFMGYICVAPELKEANSIKATEFSTEWNAVEGATSYTLEVSPFTVGQELISEDFSGFQSGNASSPDGTDISDKLDQFTQTEGWIGSEANQAGGACLVGAKSKNGYLTTPKVDLSNNTIFTLYIEASGSKDTQSGLVLNVVDKQDGSKILATKKVSLPSSLKKTFWTFTIDNATSGYINIKANTTARFQKIALYSGNATEMIKNGTLPSFDEALQKQTISGITANSCKVTGLLPENQYICNVKTIIDNEISEPSNRIFATTTDGSGIESMVLKNKVRVNENQIIISSQEGESVRIYTLDGVMKYSFSAQDGDNIVQTENGIYIVRIGDASTKAIVTGK